MAGFALDRVLVTCCGPIGQSIVLALAIEGIADPVVSEISPERRALLERLGARTIDPRTRDQAVDEALGGLTDATIDAVGVGATIADCLRSTRLGATVVLVGMGSPRVELDAFAVSTQERAIVGSFTCTADDFADAVVSIGTVEADRLDTLISRVVELEDAHVAFAALVAGDGTAGKVPVRVARRSMAQTRARLR